MAKAFQDQLRAEQVYVGVWGNSDPTNTTEWIKVSLRGAGNRHLLVHAAHFGCSVARPCCSSGWLSSFSAVTWPISVRHGILWQWRVLASGTW